MRVLLDTHVFLWWVNDSPRLGREARDVISNIDNQLFLSAASGWEIAIKAGLGKLEVADDISSFIFEQMRLNVVDELPVLITHALHAANLPNLHRDPFDRMLIAQAQLEKLPILTGDEKFDGYPVEIIEA